MKSTLLSLVAFSGCHDYTRGIASFVSEEKRKPMWKTFDKVYD